MNPIYKLMLIPILTCSTLSIEAVEAVHTAEKKEAAPTSPTSSEIERFTNAEKGYTIDYPSDWKKNDVPQLDFVLFGPSKGNEENPHASVNIVSEKVGPGISLDQFYSESQANLNAALKDVVVEKFGNQQINGVASKWIQYVHTMQGIKFRVLQYFIVTNETIFLITFSAAANDFDKYRQDFDNIAGSFKILNAK